jgi:hypothetical protein
MKNIKKIQKLGALKVAKLKKADLNKVVGGRMPEMTEWNGRIWKDQ